MLKAVVVSLSNENANIYTSNENIIGFLKNDVSFENECYVDIIKGLAPLQKTIKLFAQAL